MESCSHVFCFDCITEWSKVETKCPLCKRRFRFVEREVGEGEKRHKPIRCETRNQGESLREDEARDYVDAIVCRACGGGDDEANLILCDGCDAGYHAACWGLDRVPRGRWMCSECCQEQEVQRRDTRRDARRRGRMRILDAATTVQARNLSDDEVVEREGEMVARAEGEVVTRRENRIARERRRASRLRTVGEILLSGGGGETAWQYRGENHRRRQIAIVNELRDAWEKLQREEEEFPDFVDEFEEQLTQRQREENDGMNENVDAKTAWKLMDAACEAEEQQKKANKRKKKKSEQKRSEEETLRTNAGAERISTKRPKIRRSDVHRQIRSKSGDEDDACRRDSLPTFLHDSSFSENENEEEEEGNVRTIKNKAPQPTFDIAHVAADQCKLCLLSVFKSGNIDKSQYKQLVKSIVRKCLHAAKTAASVNMFFSLEDVRRICLQSCDKYN